MGRADLHIHSSYSFDSTSTIHVVMAQAAQHSRLDVIAITDHDEIDGALRARDLAPRFGIEVIPGSEISTADGHLLALWIERGIPAGLPLVETLHRVGEQGGLAIVAHPFAVGVHAIQAAPMRAALADAAASRVLMGIETINASLPYSFSNATAGLFCQRVGLAAVANSDSHVAWTIGSAATEFPGHTADHLRRALQEKTTRPVFPKPQKSIRFYLSHAYHRLLRRRGLVVWTSSLGAPMILRPVAEQRLLFD